MAKKKAGGRKSAGPPKKTARTKGKTAPLPTMEDEFTVPVDLQDAADEYASALQVKKKAESKFNTAKENVIDEMQNHGIDRVRIETVRGEKILVMVKQGKLKLEKVKEPGDS